MPVPTQAGGVIRRPLDSIPDLLALQQADPRLFPGLLESAARGTERGRYDLLLASSGETLCCGARGELHGAGAEGGDFLSALDRWFSGQRAPRSPDSDLPFEGGWLLYLGYELAGQIEPSLRLPASSLPLAQAWRCPVAVLVDHGRGQAWLVGEAGQDALLARVSEAIARTQPRTGLPVRLQALREDPPADYLQGVLRSLDYIRAGDVFQVNLSRGWQAQLHERTSTGDLYRALRSANPAPFSALLQLSDASAVISSSPERLVARRGERIETRPIAGTRPRLPGEDTASRVRELVGHPKERAEHIMLIDLERNDLGRVSVAGSVKVDELMAVESYAHVHHIESTVSGVARTGLTPGELIRAVFPGGTITGCPKVRCMQIIAELEGVARGPYTGAVGWLDRCGDLDLNILIRTLWTEGSRLHFRAGAGVVADSDPQHELDETRAKARGLLRALGQGEA